jgi:Methyltransferase domain
MIQDSISAGVKPYWHQRRSVPGHMYDIDFMIFDRLLSEQDRRVPGDLLEIGAYLGKSAIVIGAHRQTDEDFVVCDIFEAPVADSSNDKENASSYSGLTRTAFDANYARFVTRPPTVVQELSTTIDRHVGQSSIRFAHIDGGHLYETVRSDLDNALRYLLPEGLVAMDDVRSLHTPGVAAATWEFVAQERLFPICASNIKLYLSPSQRVADAVVVSLSAWFSRHPEVHFGRQVIRGRFMIVVRNPKIWTTRGRIKSLIPPAVLERISTPNRPHLGE